MSATGYQLGVYALLGRLIESLVTLAVQDGLLEAAKVVLLAIVVLEAVLVITELTRRVAGENARDISNVLRFVSGRWSNGDNWFLGDVLVIVIFYDCVYKWVFLTTSSVNIFV